MRTTLVYDLPTRIFHWLFSALFLFSFTIGKVVDDESALFIYHMLTGILLVSLILLRICWGAIGTKHAQFTNFALHPRDLKKYSTDILNGTKNIWAGHNPASSWATIIMLTLGLALGATGYLMTTAERDTYKEIHELFANSFIIVVIAHIAGVLLHTLRHSDNIALSMIDGKKQNISDEEKIETDKKVYGFVLILIFVLSSMYVLKAYNKENANLNLFGKTLQLGELEHDSDDNKKEDND